ncbi:MAG: transpeptidase family protein [Treponema sp.]|nr:transpeptidase family protein [Treponema sp.]
MQVNGFFKNIRLWIVALPCAGLLIFIYSAYVRLAFSPQPQLSHQKPVVERGSIVDRNGKPLAVQTNFYHLGVSPRMFQDAKIDAFSRDIADIIDMDAPSIAARIRAAQNLSFTYIKKKLTQNQFDEVRKIVDEKNYAGVQFDRIPGRVYPENDLASQLIGYMGDDGLGLSGIEYARQTTLAPSSEPESPIPLHGKNIYLTIDANLQYKLEKIAKKTMETTQAECMFMIAANAENGEILSYISLPSTNLNTYSQSSSAGTIDRPAVSAYEPGSVFKIFTSAACLDAGIITPDTLFLCDGIYERRTNLGERIRITCLDHHGWVNVRNALKFSCNDALAQMSELINTDLFLAYIRAFGFGERTGVELPAETRGSVKNQEDKFWSARSKATMAIGQELSVSALQMVQAATAIAGDGVPVKLTFIQRITDKDGNIEYIHHREPKERVLKSATAQYILSCMETTAQSGTGSKASLSDISIGVKTGTAQMADTVNGGYSETDFLSNCMAIFPVEKPEIVLYIVIEKAKGETYAGRIVAPVIAEAADEIIDHLGMTREGAVSLKHSGRSSISEHEALVVGSTVPNFLGRPKRDLLPLLDRTDITFAISGEGYVTRQYPPPGAPVTENMTIELVFE